MKRSSDYFDLRFFVMCDGGNGQWHAIAAFDNNSVANAYMRECCSGRGVVTTNVKYSVKERSY